MSSIPDSVPDVRQGDTIEINAANISDWSYTDKGILRCGYTIRLLRGRMTAAERAELDSMAYYRLE